MRSAWKLFVIGLCVVQVWAFSAGLEASLEWSAWLAVPVAVVIGWIPLVGAVAGAWGAATAWEWSWTQAVGAFAGIPLSGIAIVFGTAAIRHRRTTGGS